MRIRFRVVLSSAAALAIAFSLCAAASARAPSAPEQAGAALVGRWETVKTCTGVVQALKKVGLRPLAPGVVGEFFPGQPPQKLAHKHQLCRGAGPQRHSHFFSRDGLFGSLEQNGQQVDDGNYRLIDAGTIHIGNPDVHANFHFRVDQMPPRDLTLRPVITRRMRREALAHPLAFSAAGWAVAVAYAGHTWSRVPCRQWC